MMMVVVVVLQRDGLCQLYHAVHSTSSTRYHVDHHVARRRTHRAAPTEQSPPNITQPSTTTLPPLSAPSPVIPSRITRISMSWSGPSQLIRLISIRLSMALLRPLPQQVVASHTTWWTQIKLIMVIFTCSQETQKPLNIKYLLHSWSASHVKWPATIYNRFLYNMHITWRTIIRVHTSAEKCTKNGNALLSHNW